MNDIVTAPSHSGTRPDPNQFRQVLGQYPTGVVVVTAAVPGSAPAALTIGSFTSVSLDPPLVAFYPDKRSSSWPRIQEQGRFVVNILGADQEVLCRKFAQKGEDKFAGVPWRPAANGAPIIEGVVAWIECTLAGVQEAGDHYSVLGLVETLDVESGALPLLFFRGGYGRFTPSSLASADSRVFSILPVVDKIRPELESIARDCGCECLLAARVGDEFVVLAGARPDSAVSAPTRVGRRLPYKAPVGVALAAWADEAERAAWAVGDASAGQSWDAALAVVRERGYAIGLGAHTYANLERTIDRSGATSPAADTALRSALDKVRQGSEEQPRIEASTDYELRSLSAAVFAPQGVLQIGLYGVDGTTGGQTVERLARRVVQGAERATSLLGGVPPAPR